MRLALGRAKHRWHYHSNQPPNRTNLRLKRLLTKRGCDRNHGRSLA